VESGSEGITANAATERRGYNEDQRLVEPSDAMFG
jgi:hypothetical protein